jgi:TPR repeat protein
MRTQTNKLFELSKSRRLGGHYCELPVHESNEYGQSRDGRCLCAGKGGSIDVRSAAHDFKISADQSNACGQCFNGLCLHHGEGISIDLKSTATSGERLTSRTSERELSPKSKMR